MEGKGAEGEREGGGGSMETKHAMHRIEPR